MQSAEDTRESSRGEESPRYLPIGDYGAIGDCRTAALVAPNGSIDWLCMPHFDSPAFFCRLLDADRGGYFRLSPGASTSAAMAYLPGTNILETTFTTSEGRLRLLDFMPIRQRRPNLNPLQMLGARFAGPTWRLPTDIDRELGNDVAAAHRVDRLASCLEGEVRVELVLKATFDYARGAPQMLERSTHARGAGAILTDGARYLALAVRLSNTSPPAPAEFELQGDADLLQLHVPLTAGQTLVAALNYARSTDEARAILGRLFGHSFQQDLAETQTYWQRWSARNAYIGPYQDAVRRSALALKLCTFEPTGAIVAAPTTSLPEAIAGVRNWDYRYTWLRDSSFTVQALGRLGYFEEARDYLHFLHDLQIHNGHDLRIMYGVRGETGDWLREIELNHLEGYQGSRPVRIGNGAASQRQLDVYGELLDAAYAYVAHQNVHDERRRKLALHRDLRHFISLIADHVVDHWTKLDRGIWEVRGAPRAFVFSRVMCWVALDRATRLAGLHQNAQQAARWREAADAIRADVLANGFDRQIASFIQAYGAEATPALDAANLRVPTTGFVEWDSPEAGGTLRATQRALSAPRGLLYRYRSIDGEGNPTNGLADDGLPGNEGAFLACSFWLVGALCRSGKVDDARERFEQLLTMAGSLGLFAEEADPTTGALLGNYPQAFTHIGLINSAVTLQQAHERLRSAHGHAKGRG